MKYLVLPAVLGVLVFTPPEYQPFRFASLSVDPGIHPIADTSARAHSHNDYSQDRPLWDALQNRFYSVEADVWLRRGELVVSHLGLNWVGRLRELYLEPLQRRVAKLGSVYGDGKGFLLWIDVKQESLEVATLLQEAFVDYPMLTRFIGKDVVPGPVTVILTGNRAVKKRYAENRVRFACHDSLRYNAEDPPGGGDPSWCWYALNWERYFKWDGKGSMPDAEARALRSLVKGVHEKGRKLRFWNAPDTPEVWAATRDAGVDLVATDMPGRLGQFFGSRALASDATKQP